MTNAENLESALGRYFQKAAETPNAPFLFDPAKRMVITELEQIGFSDSAEPGINNELQYTQDDFALYAKVKRGNPQHKLIITSHLDHPFVVLDGKGGGIPLGSIGSERLRDQAESEGIPIKVFSKEGEQVAIDTIVSIDIGSRQTKVGTEYRQPYSANAHAIWDIEPLVIEDGKIKMINADNMANTAIMLSLMREIAQDTSGQPIDVEFIFAYLEEIKQVASTGIALRGSTPYGQIDINTLIIVLESGSSESSEIYEDILSELELKRANYDDGVIIRINDKYVVYGQQYGLDNKTENLLLQAAQDENVSYQQTLLSGTCDATVYTLFSKTPHIASITIPTRHKHNWGEQGEITHEEVLIRDVEATKAVLLNAVFASGNDVVPKYHENAKTKVLKATRVAATNQELSNLKKDRIATYFSVIQRLKKVRFYPENLSDRAHFIYGGAIARITNDIFPYLGIQPGD